MTGVCKRALLVAFAVFTIANWAYPQVGSPPFLQDPLPDGVVSIEAEHYHHTVVTNGISWEFFTNITYSGGLAMKTLPNTGVTYNADYVINSPRMDYMVHFNNTGTHYVVVRGVEPDGDNQADSVHAGLNGVGVGTSDRISGFGSNLRWSMSTFDGTNQPARFEVASTGLHTVNIWMREDGFIVDKFLLSKNPDFEPEDDTFGPPESLQSSPDDEDGIQETYITGMWLSNGMIQASVMPVAGADDYMVSSMDVLGGTPTNDPSGSVYGYQLQAGSEGDAKFYAVEVMPIETNAELGVLALHRLAYGPTPDELDRVVSGGSAIGGHAYIAEQMEPELLTESADSDPEIAAIRALFDIEEAYLDDLQAWHILRAIRADRQLLEVLTQFFNNHFVTYYWKSRSWIRNDGGETDSLARRMAAELELRELTKWREILMDPDGTFYDLLKVSAESPSMIIFLDTVKSDKDSANENYSREIMELFCMGVDNGYSQDDIEEMSRCWTGWRLQKVALSDVDNPHAPAFGAPIYHVTSNSVWSFRKGTNEPAANWFDADYVEDGSWSNAQAIIGYGEGDESTLLSDMEDNYSSFYVRRTFSGVSDPSNIPFLKLNVYYDDGFVAYLNGQEIARDNVSPGTPTFDDTASSSHGSKWESFFVTNAAGILTTGQNVLAVHLLNVSLGSSDASLNAEIYEDGVWAFTFDPTTHDTNAKVMFASATVDARFGQPYAGVNYELSVPQRDGTNGIQDGYDIIEHLANLPYTQEFISMKLCQLFVHDDFSFGGYYNISQRTDEEQLMHDCMTAWNTPAGDGRKGNIRAVLDTIFSSDLFRGQSALRHKVKTPLEYTVSAIRALRGDLGAGLFASSTDGYDMIDPMDDMGMEPFVNFSPDGWAEDGSEWIDTGTVNERLRFIQNYMMREDDPLKDEDYGSSDDDNLADPVGLLMDRVPAGDWNNDNAVTDFFLKLIYPGEGLANVDLDRDECLFLLNSDESGMTNASPFIGLSTTSTNYDLRVRSLVGLLLSGPKFNEQ